MQDIRPAYQFGDFAREAGLGRNIWGQTASFAATYYHYIIALFCTGILVCVLPGRASPLMITTAIAVYLGYVILRKLATKNHRIEQWFYQRTPQFIRAQLGILGITVLMIVTRDSEQTALWLLYPLVILLTSKHCTTEQMLVAVGESCLAVALVRWQHGLALPVMLQDPDLWASCLCIGLLAFVLHYLVRNVQARDETIAAHNAVIALARDIDMTDATSDQQWQPMLVALLKYLGGECATTWTCDWKTRQMRLVASVRRSPQQPDRFDMSNSAKGLALGMDSHTLMAEVARSGRVSHSALSDDDPALPSYLRCNPQCPEACIELAVPIKMSATEGQLALGVLSVGFRPSAFRANLLPDYQNYMQGLVSLAKPMLAYAQRFEDLLELQAASQQVWRSFDLTHVLDTILHALVNRLGFEFAVISLVEDENLIIRSVRGVGVPQEWLDAAIHSLDSNDIQADIVRTGRTEVLKGWDERFDKQIWSEFGHAKLIRVFMPIKVIDALTRQERIIGTIETGYSLVNRAEIDPDQLRLLGAFRDQVSMAIEHARLLQRIQKKADILTSLHRAGQAIAAASQPPRLLQEIAHNARSLLNADIVMVYRYHRDAPKIEQPVMSGEIGKKHRLKLDLDQQNILTKLLRDTKPYYSANAQTDQSLVTQTGGEGGDGKNKRTFIQLQNIKSFAGIPLVADGDTVGVMFVNYRKRHPFDDDERQVHELLAQQVAAALKNAESNELQRDLIVRDERNHLSRELHHSVSQALFGITLKAQRAARHMGIDDSKVRAELDNILEIAHVASNETLFMIEELRAPIEESRNLKRGLEEYTQRITRWYGLQVVLDHGLCPPLPLQHEQALIRFAREAINNAVRHSHCKAITVRCEAQGNSVLMSVHDDGIGFEPSQVPPHKLGLKSMRELAESVGGHFWLETAAGEGTTVNLQILEDTEEA